jgi:hypothetical protein
MTGDPSTERVEQTERTQRAERAVRGVLAGTLGLEALMVLFVPRAIAQTGPGLTTGRLVVLLVLFALLLVTAFVVPRRAGLILGTVLQFAVIACGMFTLAMYVLGVIFLAIWVYELRVRSQLLRR